MAIQRAGCKKAIVHLQSVRVRVLEGLLAGSYLFPIYLRGDGGETSPLRLAVRLARTGSPEASPNGVKSEILTQKAQISAEDNLDQGPCLRFVLLLQIIYTLQAMSASASSSSALLQSLELHNSAFEQLLSLIPPRHYILTEPDQDQVRPSSLPCYPQRY